jgi:hypothetical protein
LLTTSFGVFSAGKLHITQNITDAIKNQDLSKLSPITLDTPNFLWPNFAKVVPESVFNQRVIVVPDGFLPPGKNNGGVYLVVMDSTDITKTVKTVTITHNKSGYFYHMGFWMDLNGDGRMDFLTAKSNAKVGQGELVWYEHPAEGLDATENWTEHIITTGPDVEFDAVMMD